MYYIKYISNIIYISLGKGGGTRAEGIGYKNGQQDLQSAYNGNRVILTLSVIENHFEDIGVVAVTKSSLIDCCTIVPELTTRNSDSGQIPFTSC